MVYAYPKLKAARAAAHAHGAAVWSSQRYPYKLYVVIGGKKIHFGDRRAGDYLINPDKSKRASYLARSRQIRDGRGRLTYNNPLSANYWARVVLWAA